MIKNAKLFKAVIGNSDIAKDFRRVVWVVARDLPHAAETAYQSCEGDDEVLELTCHSALSNAVLIARDWRDDEKT